ncbi:hypothetical protein F383_19630 [Gossypium arboreum]|uniref:Uncharacterized protein n=1 Tax=Gossypium arboreum TaxID=29729 RepID=A0A0B0NVG6_GOSAR|nr:hypothetical protein F383_19630 [Gossypium arboreum]
MDDFSLDLVNSMLLMP